VFEALMPGGFWTGYSGCCDLVRPGRICRGVHGVRAPKYRFRVLHGEVRLRVREIIRHVCDERGVTIIHGSSCVTMSICLSK